MDDLNKVITDLRAQVARLTAEREHWKANHDNQVQRARVLMERPDLPVDRLPVYREFERLTAERDALKQSSESLAKGLANTVVERDALREDAERYRWLRDMDEDPVQSLAAQYTDCNGSAISIANRIDAAIDAARKGNERAE